MNVTKRFLVLNTQNIAQCPSASNFHGPDQKGGNSPSFLKKESAMAFADFLAKRAPGTNYYLAEILSGTVQYTDPVPAGDWVAATEDTAE